MDIDGKYFFSRHVFCVRQTPHFKACLSGCLSGCAPVVQAVSKLSMVVVGLQTVVGIVFLERRKGGRALSKLLDGDAMLGSRVQIPSYFK
jgi:hypothetical protein